MLQNISRVTSLRCPSCTAHPALKVHETVAVNVLFCTSCEHAWVMDSACVARRSGRPADARSVSVYAAWIP